MIARTMGAAGFGARSIAPGLMICLTIALAATFLSEHYGGPQFLYALLFGMSLNFLTPSDSARTVLRLGVALLTQALGLDATAAGIFLGATIHDVAQVVGAGYIVSPEAGDVATVVKLPSVAMLLPVVALVGIYFGRREGGQSSSLLATVPWFLLVFAALVIVISLHWVPPPLVTAMQDTSRWCLVVAIAGLGVKTSIQQLAQVGWRPIAVLLANTVFLAVFAGRCWHTPDSCHRVPHSPLAGERAQHLLGLLGHLLLHLQEHVLRLLQIVAHHPLHHGRLHAHELAPHLGRQALRLLGQA